MEDTAERGIAAFISEVTQRGGKALRLTTSKRNPVKVWGAEGSVCVVRVRSKKAGDWQASRQDESLESDDSGSKFWVFVDLASSPEGFFVVPSAEIAADIRCEVDLWVKESPGRNRTGHHAIAVNRVVHGRARWDLLGLADEKDPELFASADAARTASARRTRVPARRTAKSKSAEEEQALADYIGKRLRVVADFEGYRLIGLFDPANHGLEITRGPMEGRRFKDPTIAASAVASHISGDTEVRDGWKFWEMDTPDRAPLDSHRN